jgi:hypothetical protein
MNCQYDVCGVGSQVFSIVFTSKLSQSPVATLASVFASNGASTMISAQLRNYMSANETPIRVTQFFQTITYIDVQDRIFYLTPCLQHRELVVKPR